MLEKAIDEKLLCDANTVIYGKVAQTPEEAVQLLYETPVWDISIRKICSDMIGDTLSSQNTDTLSLLQQKQIKSGKGRQ